MVRLYDASTGELRATITDAQLAEIVGELEEESTEDRDYFVDTATIEMLERRGADQGLVAALREALGERVSRTLVWEREADTEVTGEMAT